MGCGVRPSTFGMSLVLLSILAYSTFSACSPNFDKVSGGVSFQQSAFLVKCLFGEVVSSEVSCTM